MKIKYIFALLMFSVGLFAQEKVDLTTPKQSEFSAGQNIEGSVKNSINEITGKVALSVPITSITSRSVSHAIGLFYSGKSAFEIAKNTNRHAPTSWVGVGFDLTIPKIVVNNKNTATREDDDFYLQDGVNNTKLICANKKDIEPLENSVQKEWIKEWDFVTETYTTLKIKYYSTQINNIYVNDFFKVTTNDGVDYYYGTLTSRDDLLATESVVAWQNWIGDSNQTTGGTAESIVWNLSKIQDQWNNNITFKYLQQQQLMGGTSQTEASYLSKVIASTGEVILFNYLDKNIKEYYEPHIEKPEPDAFQERYEKKYLNTIQSFNSKGTLTSTFEFNYDLITTAIGENKRYLNKVIQKNPKGKSLPSQRFEYYTDGDFNGGIRKIHYPMGGSTTYNYENKYLFKNFANLLNSFISYDGFSIYGTLVRDNYVLQLLKSKNSVGDDRYVFKIRRHWWNGNKWEVNEHTIPHNIKNTNNIRLENLQFFFKKDSYGYLYTAYKTEKTYSQTAFLNIFYLKKEDGRTWDYYSQEREINDLNCRLVSGDDFVAYGEYDHKPHPFGHNRGGIFFPILQRVGDKWVNKGWGQPPGEYSYAATNNFIMKHTGTDYQLYYLDATKKWVIKSWANTVMDAVRYNGHSTLFADDSMIGLVHDEGQEFVLTWDKSYNPLTPYGTGGFDDRNPMISVLSSMFTNQHWFNEKAMKSWRFNGNNWSEFQLGGSRDDKTTYGKDILAFQNHNSQNTTGFALYDPNYNNWQFTTGLNTYNAQINTYQLTGITQDFLIASNQIFRFNNNNIRPQFNQNIPLSNTLTVTDGLGKGFVQLSNLNISNFDTTFEKSMLYYIDKKTDQIVSKDLGKLKSMLSTPSSFSGHTQFLSNKSIFLREFYNEYNFYIKLYRFINDEIDNDIYDIVVNKIEINNGINDKNRTITYSYTNFNCTPDNNVVYYGTVEIADKGYGNSNVGTSLKKFNTGATDSHMTGVLLEEFISDGNDKTLVHKKNTYSKMLRKYVPYDNEQFETKTAIIDRYNVNLIKTESRITSSLTNNFTLDSINYNYSDSKDLYNLLKSTVRKNLKGQIEVTELDYGFETEYNLRKRNFVTQPSKITTKIDNNITSVKKNNWSETPAVGSESKKIYQSSTSSGPSALDLRSGLFNSKIDDYGNIIETKEFGMFAISNAVVYGYNYKYPILTVNNATYDSVVSLLEVTIANLQSLSNSSLKTELSKLYVKLPTDTSIEINLYDDEGRVVEKINNRQSSVKYFYDEFGRLDYTTDQNDKVLKKNVYNYNLK